MKYPCSFLIAIACMLGASTVSAMEYDAIDDFTVDTESPSKVDVSGNLTIQMNETYKGDINIPSGVLTVGANAAVAGNVRARKVVLEDNSEITGSVTAGADTVIENNVAVSGSVTTNTLSVGHNVNISGAISVQSAATPIYVGDNVAFKSTLTSKAGLKIGHNSNVKLFLSGDTVEVDGTSYKLGGRVVSSGHNTSVGLPPVPKLKNTDGTDVKVTAHTGAVAFPASNEARTTATVRASTTLPSVGNVVPVATSAIEKEVDAGIHAVHDYYADLVPMEEIEGIVSPDDLSAYVEKVSRIEKNVSSLNLSEEGVAMEYKVPALLFGLIPLSMAADVSVSKEKEVDVEFPWYSFMFSTPADATLIKESVSNAVEGSLGSGSTESFTTKMQAVITSSVLTSLRGLFGGSK